MDSHNIECNGNNELKTEPSNKDLIYYIKYKKEPAFNIKKLNPIIMRNDKIQQIFKTKKSKIISLINQVL